MPLKPPSPEELRALAAGQLLELSDEQFALLANEFELLVKVLARLERLDTKGVVPMDYGRDAKLGVQLRADEPFLGGFGRQALAANTPRLTPDAKVKVKGGN